MQFSHKFLRQGTRVSTLILLLFSYSHAYAIPKSQPTATPSTILDQQLIWAIETNNYQTVKKWVIGRKNINGQDFFGYSALHYAVKHNQIAIVSCLIEANILLNQQSIRSGNTPLLLAIKIGNKPLVMLLLEAGADTEIKDHSGYNALHRAIQQKDVVLVKLLLDATVSCNSLTADGIAPLLMATQLDNLPMVQLLLQKKNIDVTCADQKGYTALHWAIKNNSVSILQSLLKTQKCNINASAKNGATALHLIASNRKLDDALATHLLAMPMLNVNSLDSTGSAPLHYAVHANHLKAVNRLLSIDVINIDIQNKAGQTPLHYAVYNQHTNIVKKLLLHSTISITVKNKKGIAPLEAAMQHKKPTIYKILLHHMNCMEPGKILGSATTCA